MPFDLSSYEPVEARLAKFWADHPNGSIVTECVTAGVEGHWLFKTTVFRDVNDDRAAATGYAHEVETVKGVNSTSAAENCETSSTGRALANLGYAPKGARPSREEMSKAERSQEGRASSPAREPGPPPPEGFATHEESHKEIEFCRNGIKTFGLEDWVKDQNFPWPWPKAACDAIAAKIAAETKAEDPF